MRVGRAGGGCAHLKDGVHSSPEILVHIQIFHGLLSGIESFKPNSSKFQGWIESLALCTDTSGPPTLRATQRTSASILPARATHGLLKTTACGYPIVVEIHSCHESSQKNLKFQTWSVYFSQESRIHTLRKCWLKHISNRFWSEWSLWKSGHCFLGGRCKPWKLQTKATSFTSPKVPKERLFRDLFLWHPSCQPGHMRLNLFGAWKTEICVLSRRCSET